MLETTALLEHKFGIDTVRLFETKLRPVIEITWVDEQIHKLGMGILITANRRNLSLVDCISFEIMRQVRLEKAFTFDPHFLSTYLAVDFPRQPPSDDQMTSSSLGGNN